MFPLWAPGAGQEQKKKLIWKKDVSLAALRVEGNLACGMIVAFGSTGGTSLFGRRETCDDDEEGSMLTLDVASDPWRPGYHHGAEGST